MIPIHLTLRNFLSYRDTTELDFSDLRLACISGANGAGKSAILEAITWALFGKSRVKSDDDVVNRDAARDGQAAEVFFTFELEGVIYRVIRRKAPRKTAELEFNARIPGEGDERWQVKTEAKIRETESEIEKLLRMNYDVFTNASFFLQGKADEFTVNPPGKRKEILAEILGVKQWDEYKELATARRKEVDMDVAAVERQMDEVDAELLREDEYTQTLKMAEIQVNAATAERDRQDALVTAARQNKTRADQQRESLRQITGDLTRAKAELARIEGLTSQQSQELARYHALLERRDAITAAYEAWEAVSQDSVALQEKANRHVALDQQINPLITAVTLAQFQMQRRVEDLQSQRARTEQAAVDLVPVRAELLELEVRRNELQGRLDGVEARRVAWQAARERLQALESERIYREQELGRLQERAREIDLLRARRAQTAKVASDAADALQTAQDALSDLLGKRAALDQKREKLAGQESDKKHLHDEMMELKERVTTLEADISEDCPLCGQPLTDDHRLNAIELIKSQGKERATIYRAKESAIGVLRAEVDELTQALKKQAFWDNERGRQQVAVSRAEEQLRGIDAELVAWRDRGGDEQLAGLADKLSDRTEQDELQEQVERSRDAAAQAEQLNQALRESDGRIIREQAQLNELENILERWESGGRLDLQESERRLADEDFALDERARLAELQAQQADIAYDASAYEAARSRLKELAAAPEEHRKLTTAEAAAKLLVDNLGELERRSDAEKAAVSSLEARLTAGETHLRELESGIGNLAAAESELVRLREAVIQASSAVGAARQRVDTLAVRKKDREELAARKTDLSRQISLLKQLEEACGRNGVQALLIDAALPEIESYANELLGRLSNGSMEVKFKTLREAKSKRDLIETLDIAIIDDFGERPYENYSGGEKFRVNFAIRLALSMVLARRAGARLRTLVIDEGFGTQDPEGRQRLVEAINVIQGEFDCILVITHIDELRDKFPARIDVEKSASGSRFVVTTL